MTDALPEPCELSSVDAGQNNQTTPPMVVFPFLGTFGDASFPSGLPAIAGSPNEADTGADPIVDLSDQAPTTADSLSTTPEAPSVPTPVPSPTDVPASSSEPGSSVVDPSTATVLPGSTAAPSGSSTPAGSVVPRSSRLPLPPPSPARPIH